MPQMFLLSRALAASSKDVRVFWRRRHGPARHGAPTHTHLKCAQCCQGVAHVNVHKPVGPRVGTGTCTPRLALLVCGFARALTCIWRGEHPSTHVCVHIPGFAAPELLSGSLQCTVLGRGTSLCSKQRFSSSNGALFSSGPSHCSMVAGAGHHLLLAQHFT